MHDRTAWGLDDRRLMEQEVRYGDRGRSMAVECVAEESQALVIIWLGYLAISRVVSCEPMVGYDESRIVHVRVGIAYVGEDVDERPHVSVPIDRVSQGGRRGASHKIVVEVDVVPLETVTMWVRILAVVRRRRRDWCRRRRWWRRVYRDRCWWCLHRDRYKRD